MSSSRCRGRSPRRDGSAIPNAVAASQQTGTHADPGHPAPASLSAENPLSSSTRDGASIPLSLPTPSILRSSIPPSLPHSSRFPGNAHLELEICPLSLSYLSPFSFIYLLISPSIPNLCPLLPFFLPFCLLQCLLYLGVTII